MSIVARTLLCGCIVATTASAAQAQPASAPGTAAPTPQPAGAPQFFVEQGGKALGPLTLAQLRAQAAAGRIAADRLVWRAGTAKWISARDLAEIADLFSATSAEPRAAGAPAGTPLSPPVKKVTTVPVAPAAGGDLSAYLTGTWKSEHGVTYAFGADGTVATHGSAADREPLIRRGTFTVVRMSAKTILLKTPMRSQGGEPGVGDEAKTLEIVDPDTMRDVHSGAVLRRATRTVQLRLKPAADTACGGGKVLLSDDFRQGGDNPSPGAGDPSVSVEDGKVKVKPGGDRRFQFIYADARLADGEMCVTAQIPRATQNPVDVVGGVIFWAHDLADYYGFAISPTGNAGLVRQVDGRFEPLGTFRKAEGLNPNPGARNVLRVVIEAGAVTAYVNGVRFERMVVAPPAGGGSVGFFGQSESARADAWKFGRLVVTGAATAR